MCRNIFRFSFSVIVMIPFWLVSCGPPTPEPTTMPSPLPVASPTYVAPTSMPTVPRTPTPGVLIVANTNGDGAFIRRTPAQVDRIRVWPEGTVMSVVGDDIRSDGLIWRNVKDPAGNIGWVAAQYLTVLTATAATTATPSPVPSKPNVDRSRYALELLGASGRWDRNSAIVEGTVRNIGASALASVSAVIQWYSASDTLVRSDAGHLEINPLPPGRVASFQAITPDQPALQRFRINFRDATGAAIPAIDSRGSSN